ncbi:uncharacterized protein JCM15063_001905 [Sporobolomyces koalae]|uniref:uncharacterized protein n=1 Tax=Sporobolomyces koalae TaxID=500713 RepID=UPI00317EA68A
MSEQQHVATSLLDHTLRTAPLKVVYSTVTFTGLGGVVGAATGVARGIEAIPASFRTALRTGVFSFTFFSLREYGCIPLLTHFNFLPSPLLSAQDPSLAPPSPHLHNFLPTTLSGILSGTIFSYLSRPTSTRFPQHVRSGTTLGIGCLVVQSLVNELDLVRIKLLNRSEQQRASEPVPDSTTTSTKERLALEPRPSILSPLPPVAPSDSSVFSDPTTLTFSERSDRMFANLWNRAKSTAQRLSPLQKIDDGEFEDKLRATKDSTKEELEQVRREIAELERLQLQQQRK